MNDFYLRPTYWNWIASEAALIDTDGCSKVLGTHVECCFAHDLAYRTGKDPHHAYLLYRGGSLEPWKEAKSISRAEVDARFRRCHQNRSPLGMYSPMAWWRWAGVRIGGRRTWAKYRADEE